MNLQGPGPSFPAEDTAHPAKPDSVAYPGKELAIKQSDAGPSEIDNRSHDFNNNKIDENEAQEFNQKANDTPPLNHQPSAMDSSHRTSPELHRQVSETYIQSRKETELIYKMSTPNMKLYADTSPDVPALGDNFYSTPQRSPNMLDQRTPSPSPLPNTGLQPGQSIARKPLRKPVPSESYQPKEPQQIRQSSSPSMSFTAAPDRTNQISLNTPNNPRGVFSSRYNSTPLAELEGSSSQQPSAVMPEESTFGQSSVSLPAESSVDDPKEGTKKKRGLLKKMFS